MNEIHELKMFSTFEKLSEDSLKKLARLIQERSYQGNEIVFNSGDKGDYLYFISQGAVEISIPISETEDRVIAVFKPGDFFGELSFLNQDNHSAKARAIEDTQMLILSNKDYERIITEEKEEGIEIQQQIMLQIISRLRDINRRYSFRPFAYQLMPGQKT